MKLWTDDPCKGNSSGRSSSGNALFAGGRYREGGYATMRSRSVRKAKVRSFSGRSERILYLIRSASSIQVCQLRRQQHGAAMCREVGHPPGVRCIEHMRTEYARFHTIDHEYSANAARAPKCVLATMEERLCVLQPRSRCNPPESYQARRATNGSPSNAVCLKTEVHRNLVTRRAIEPPMRRHPDAAGQYNQRFADRWLSVKSW